MITISKRKCKYHMTPETREKLKAIRKRAGNNTCICCGAVIPEGSQICPKCERGYNK